MKIARRTAKILSEEYNYDSMKDILHHTTYLPSNINKTLNEKIQRFIELLEDDIMDDKPIRIYVDFRFIVDMRYFGFKTSKIIRESWNDAYESYRSISKKDINFKFVGVTEECESEDTDVTYGLFLIAITDNDDDDYDEYTCEFDDRYMLRITPECLSDLYMAAQTGSCVPIVLNPVGTRKVLTFKCKYPTPVGIRRDMDYVTFTDDYVAPKKKKSKRSKSTSVDPMDEFLEPVKNPSPKITPLEKALFSPEQIRILRNRKVR